MNGQFITHPAIMNLLLWERKKPTHMTISAVFPGLAVMANVLITKRLLHKCTIFWSRGVIGFKLGTRTSQDQEVCSVEFWVIYTWCLIPGNLIAQSFHWMLIIKEKTGNYTHWRLDCTHSESVLTRLPRIHCALVLYRVAVWHKWVECQLKDYPWVCHS